MLTFGLKANFFIFPGGIDGPAISNILFVLKSRLSPCSYVRHVPLITSLCVHAQLCLTLCDLMDCSPLGSSDHGISQARILEWVTVSFSRGSSQTREQTRVSCASCIGRQVLYQLNHRRRPLEIINFNQYNILKTKPKKRLDKILQNKCLNYLQCFIKF